MGGKNVGRFGLTIKARVCRLSWAPKFDVFGRAAQSWLLLRDTCVKRHNLEQLLNLKINHTNCYEMGRAHSWYHWHVLLQLYEHSTPAPCDFQANLKKKKKKEKIIVPLRYCVSVSWQILDQLFVVIDVMLM